MVKGVAPVALFALALEGCAAYTPVDVAKPSKIDLVSATTDVARSLVAMRDELKNQDLKTGLIVDQVDVDLNVTASADQGGSQKLTIDAAKTALSGVGLTADVAGTQNSSANKGNTIHITFKNIATACLNAYGLKYANKANPPLVVYDASGTAKPANSDTSGKATTASKSCG